MRPSGILLLLLLLFAAPLLRAERDPIRLTHGPMLGHVTSDSVRVWARTSDPGSFSVKYGPARRKFSQASDAATTRLEDDCTGSITLDGLEAHPGGEESLDHDVVEVARDPLTVAHQREPFVGPHPLGDVANRCDDVQPIVEGHRADADLHGEQRSVPTATREAETRAHRADRRLGDVRGTVIDVLRPDLVRNELLDTAPDQLAIRVAEQLTRRPVGQLDPPVLSDEQQPVR